MRPAQGVRSTSAPSGAPAPTARPCPLESPVLDLVYVLATLALFALVALVLKGVDALQAGDRASTRHAAATRSERA